MLDFENENNEIEADFEIEEDTPIETTFEIVSDIVDWGNLQGNIHDQPDLIELINNKTKTFTFEQSIPSDTWIIEHNLDKYPSFFAVDSAGNVQLPDEITYENQNKITVQFMSAFAGYGYLN